MTYTWPLPAGTPISQSFGTNPGGYNPAGGHTGTDFAVPTGTPVRAAGNGTVTFADWATTLPADYRADGSGPNPYWLNPAFGGIVVAIDHGPGQPVSIHAHLSQTDLNVGDSVSQGQVIGLSGATGGASSGPHLHFEMMPDGWNFNNGTYGRVDPATFCTDYWSDAPAAQPVSGNQRRVVVDKVNYRKAPNTSSEIVQTFVNGDVLNFSQWTHGELVGNTDIWLKGALTGGYIWVGALDPATEAGLSQENAPAPAPVPAPKPAPAPAPVPAPPVAPTPAPVPEKYTFKADFDFVEVIPAGIGNFQSGNFPTAPTTAVIHQFGTPGTDTVNSTINTFQNTGGRLVSAHFVVSGKRIIQMVSLSDRAYHAGSVGNNFVGIETDPAQDAATIASTKRLLAALHSKYGYALTLTRHKDVPGNNTSCGTLIDLGNYTETPATAPVVTPVPTPVVVDRDQVIKDFQDWQRAQFLKST